MTARNDITGDSIATKASSDAYRDNYERIFGKKTASKPVDEKQLAPHYPHNDEPEGSTPD